MGKRPVETVWTKPVSRIPLPGHIFKNGYGIDEWLNIV